VVIPDTSKAKGELTQAWIQHQVPGQSINEMINYLPGVSFQNSDPYGSTSGTLMIRGFDASRISETFDGMTLNDDGGYALYSGELLDSEVIDKVTVNLGTTDVDSPTSSASGSTVNFISHMPSDDFHVKVAGSAGTDAYMRMFGMIETGRFGPGARRHGSRPAPPATTRPTTTMARSVRTSIMARSIKILAPMVTFVAGRFLCEDPQQLLGLGAAFERRAGRRQRRRLHLHAQRLQGGLLQLCRLSDDGGCRGHADKANTCGSA
jgi:iron complex outermembrane receptor protein